MEMGNRNLIRTGMAFLALCAALPALADTQFRVRRMTRDDVPLGKGQCDIRLQVDNEVEVTVRRDMVYIHTISGRDAYDDGNSECNAPLPDRPSPGFNFEVFDRRGDIALLAEPSRRNNFAAIIRIRDGAGGFGRYHFRLSWQMTGGDDFGREGRGYQQPPFDRRGPEFPNDRPSVPGFAWYNVIHFSGAGRGQSALAGFGPERLMGVNVDIDRGGRLIARFRTDSGRPLVLTGRIIDREGVQYKVDAMTEDRRLRGPMYLTLNSRDEVNTITFEGTNGRDRMRLNWDRR